MSRALKLRFLALLTGAALAASGCGSPKVSSRIPRASSPSVTTEPPIMTTPPTSAEPVADAPADLHDVDWSHVPIPGGFCGIPGSVTFKGDEATATSRTWGRVHLFRYKSVVYGDIDGDRRSEAGVTVLCDNGGGTAAGDLAFALVVFEGVRGRLITIGTVTPRKNPPGVHPTWFRKVELKRGRVTAYEAWFRPSDSTCCPTGTAVTVWTLENGHLTPGAPRITS
jgi:hypothetical protein